MTNQLHFLTTCICDALKRECKPNEIIIEEHKKMFESRVSAGTIEKIPGGRNLTQKMSRDHTIWKDTRKSALRDIVNWQTKIQSRKTKSQTPCLDEHRFKEELELVGELSKVCSQIVLTFLYLARIGRLDILLSLNKLARAAAKWTRACDRRLARLMSHIHCHVGNTAQHCRLGLFQDSDFAGDFEDSESTSDGISCVFGSHTFVPIRWMCKKQTSVSHTSTESEVISSDAALLSIGGTW